MTGPVKTVPLPDVVERWTNAVIDRHMGSMTTTEFLKAARALSARYVERRSELGKRSPIDSAGKRAAFAGFFAPLHLVTAIGAIHALGPAIAPVSHLTDLGCGTGVASAAWALTMPTPATITGVDIDAWSLDEAVWNWRALGLAGRTSRGDLLGGTAPQRRSRQSHGAEAIVLGWSVNELSPASRHQLLATLLERVRRGVSLLVLEPLARSAVPWWADWSGPVLAAGGRADEWKLNMRLPERLQELDHAAGFRRDALGVRTLFVGPGRSDGAPDLQVQGRPGI
ncbi:MAG: class I SAM-dependent methyltransferase [Acidobacteriota bacterium]